MQRIPDVRDEGVRGRMVKGARSVGVGGERQGMKCTRAVRCDGCEVQGMRYQDSKGF